MVKSGFSYARENCLAMLCSGSPPQAPGVTLFGHRKRHIRKDLEEIFRSKQFSRSLEEEYERNQHHDARIDDEPRHSRHPAHGSASETPRCLHTPRQTLSPSST